MKMAKKAFWQTVDDLSAAMPKKYPAVFFSMDYRNPRPLAIGIGGILVADNPDIDPAAIRQFLRRYTRRKNYLKSIIAGVRRVNLDGSDAEEICDGSRRHAQGILENAA